MVEGTYVPVGTGEHGPFSDGRTIPFVKLSDGEQIIDATIAEGVEAPQLFKSLVAKLQIRSTNKGLKLRYLGAAA